MDEALSCAWHRAVSAHGPFSIRMMARNNTTRLEIIQLWGSKKHGYLLLSCVTKVAHGKNPQDIKRTARNVNSVTVTWCYEQFLKRYLQPHLRTWKIYDRRLTVDVLPALGNKDIREVKKADIIKIIDGITDRNAPILANRVLQYMSKFFKWCVGRGYIEHNPTINIPKPAREHSRERVLNLAKARSIYHAAECLGLINCAFVRLLMLTGQRRSEISNLEWSELKDNKIEIGSHRSIRSNIWAVVSWSISVRASLILSSGADDDRSSGRSGLGSSFFYFIYFENPRKTESFLNR